MNVSKYMTSKLHKAEPEMSVRDAFLLMKRERVRHLLVVDDGELVGMISDRDLRRPKWAEDLEDWTNYYQIDDDLRVSDVMTKNPETVCTRDSILDAVQTFRKRRYGALPVLNRKGELVGILSPQDLLGALEELLEEKGTE